MPTYRYYRYKSRARELRSLISSGNTTLVVYDLWEGRDVYRVTH